MFYCLLLCLSHDINPSQGGHSKSRAAYGGRPLESRPRWFVGRASPPCGRQRRRKSPAVTNAIRSSQLWRPNRLGGTCGPPVESTSRRAASKVPGPLALSSAETLGRWQSGSPRQSKRLPTSASDSRLLGQTENAIHSGHSSPWRPLWRWGRVDLEWPGLLKSDSWSCNVEWLEKLENGCWLVEQTAAEMEVGSGRRTCCFVVASWLMFESAIWLLRWSLYSSLRLFSVARWLSVSSGRGWETDCKCPALSLSMVITGLMLTSCLRSSPKQQQESEKEGRCDKAVRRALLTQLQSKWHWVLSEPNALLIAFHLFCLHYIQSS